MDRIDDKRDDLIDLTRALIRIPTTNPPGEYYEDCTRFLGERLSKRNFAVEHVRANGAIGDSDRYPRANVIGRWSGARSGPTVHFNSHIDVVEPGIGWTYDPFAADVVGDRIYGRGACDMKGGLAASVIAVEALIELAPDLAGNLEISGTADEESGGYGGVAYLSERGYFSSPRIDHVIIPEPLNKDRICLGHRGVWWAEIETRGRIAHGSMPFLGDCAVRHMGAVVSAFEEELFPLLAEKRTHMPVVPEGAKQSTLNINSLHGGQNEGNDGLPSPLVPDSCRMIIDRRFLIEESLDEVKSEVRRILDRLRSNRETFEYDLRDLFEVVPSMTDENAPVVTSVARAISRVLEKPPEYVVSPGTYDQKHIDRIGRLKDCIAYGPGILDLAHQVDEYVSINDMLDSAKVMAISAYELISGEEIAV
jgi:succinyl-diaminopimelate desuccinylase